MSMLEILAIHLALVLLIVALALALWVACEGPMYDYDDWDIDTNAADPALSLEERSAKLDADLKAAQQRHSVGKDTYSDLALTEEKADG